MTSLGQLVCDIQAVLTPDLLHPTYLRQWRPSRHPYWGHCYAATEAVWHMLPRNRQGEWYPAYVKIAMGTHWLLLSSNYSVKDIRYIPGHAIIDPTHEQFAGTSDYSYYWRAAPTPCGFLTTKPSKRAEEIIRRVKKMRRTLNRVRSLI